MNKNFDQHLADVVIKEKMLGNDAFSQWLGIEVLEILEDQVVLSMLIRPDMTNGFGIAHGGIVFSLCDSAFAFASNQYGRKAVSIETNISHLRPLYVSEKVFAKATLTSLSKSLGRYQVIATNQENKKVAIFNGTVFYTGEWDVK